MSLARGVSPDVDEAVVISGGNKVAIPGEVDVVDMSTVSSAGEDAVDEPTELGVVGSPGCADRVRRTIRVLLV